MIGAYSHSALSSFRNCPRQFKFQYIEKPQIPKTVGAEAYLGNALHRVLQDLYVRGADGVEIPLDDALRMYIEIWEKLDRDKIKVVSDYMGVDDYIRLGREMLERHYEKYRPFKHGTLLGTEMFLSFTLPGTPFKLRAVIDRLWKRDDGIVEICDYKTGRHLPRPTDPNFFYQMGLYQLAVMENFPQYKDIEVVQYFLRLDETVSFRFTPEDIDKLVEDIRVAILMTLEAEKMDDFPPQESSLCDWCDYYQLCPAKRHKKLLEGEGDDDSRTAAEQLHDKATEYIEKYLQQRELKSELDALKDDLTALSEEMNVTRAEAANGTLNFTIKQEQKFLTKTDSAAEFADLSALVREMGLEEYFKLDGNALMKEAYLKGRFNGAAAKKLEPFIREKRSVRVTVKPDIPDKETD